jgi:thiol-disulfide isomerase/thioredoxin
MSRQVTFGSSLSTGGDTGVLSKAKNFVSSYWVIIIALIVFTGIAIYYYSSYVATKQQTNYSVNNEHGTTSSQTNDNKEAELLLFYVDWCPHCKTAKPVWNDIKSEYENKTINGYKVIFTEVNCTEETAEVEQMMNKYNIEGFPTIKLLKDGQIIEYDAKPTKDTLTQFLNTVL